MKRISLIFFGIIILLLASYYNDTIYDKLVKSASHQYLVKLIDSTVNEVDITRIFNQNELSNKKYVDLILSGDDLKDLQSKMHDFVNNGFIVDQDNNWRKAKVLIDGKKEKVKYKLHGTSVSSMRMGLTPWEILKEKFSYSDKDKLQPSIGSGSFSLKIKHKKDSRYRGLMRRYTLINGFDEAELSTIVVNKIASNLGLIAPYGEMVILRINNAEVGAYMLVESHNKEWLERTHQLTSYTIMKSNDDWDRKNEAPHLSDTDLYIQNKEIKTTSLHYRDALGALKFLLNAVHNRDIDRIKKVVDMEYMAKYMALLSITNNPHPITGDNLRYIYDHSTGLFRLLFRLEDKIVPNHRNITEFNSALFASEKQYEGSGTHELFKTLLTDPNFLRKRDRELYYIIQNYTNYTKIADKVFNDNMDVLYASKGPIRPIHYKIKRFKLDFENNIEKAKKYIDYNKVFVTKYTDLNKGKSLQIMNDFNHSLILRSVTRKLNDGKITKTQVNIPIRPLALDTDLKLIYKLQKIDIDTNGISELVFVNSITGQIIEQKHVYINEATEFPYFPQSQTLKMLDVNNINYTIDVDTKRINIKTGSYNIKENVIVPDGFNLNIESGTKLLLDADVSFLVQGSVKIEGKKDSPVTVRRFNPNKPFGVFAIMGNGASETVVNVNYLIVDGGSQALINGISFTGQFSIHKADVTIDNSIFVNSLSDDGINIKYSKVEIKNSKFMNNFGDQIDLDFCTAVVINNIFSYKQSKILNSVSTDGLDISGSIVNAYDNSFKNFSDKGISVGEGSVILIKNNDFYNNYSAISVKDGSNAIIGTNTFRSNVTDISQYIKKKFYNNPNTYTIDGNQSLIQKIQDGTVFYVKEHELIERFRDFSKVEM